MKTQPTGDQILRSAREAFEKASGKQTLETTPDEEFYSSSQWTSILGRVDQSNTKIVLDRLVAQGKAEKKQYRVGGHNTIHYRIK